MGIDATAATHAIIRPVATVDQIGEAFDDITYAKGQAVIDMMEAALGADAFRRSIRSYMARYKYGNTVTEQLWRELSTAAGRDVSGIAHDFTLQGGVPLVTLAGSRCRSGGTVATLTQGRFGLDAESRAPRQWHVPIALATLKGGEASATVFGAAPTTVTVAGCGTLVLNRGKAAYVRVMYDEAGHAAIVRDYPQLALEDRLGTLGDDYALAAGGYQDLSRYFAVQDRVAIDASPLEWSVVARRMGSLAALFNDTGLEAPLRARTVERLAPVLARIGVAPRDGESTLNATLREDLIARLGANGDPALLARARGYVARLGTDPTAIPAAIRQPILSTYAINATPADWDALLALTRAERSPVAKNRFVSLLGASRDEGNARRALALLTGGDLTAPQKALLLRGIAGAHPDLAFDWAVAHRGLAESFVEQSSQASYIVGLGAGSNDPAMPGKITAFAEKTLPETSRGPARRAVSAIAVRKATADRLRPATARWLGL